MKGILKIAFLTGAVAALSVSFLAQWKPHPTPGVPRNAAGQPDLTAPAPKTRDGKTDFTGIWQNGGGGRGGRGRGGAAAAAETPPAAPAIPNANFGNVGAGFPEGLPMRPESAALVAKRMADNSKDNPDAHCLPMGFMQFHTHPQPRKIIQTPEVMVIIYEANSGLRQIFLDGRTHPPDDAEPWWYGYSVGKWEGDTLVVETRGFRGNEWLDVRGSPLSDAAKVTERFRRVNYGTLEIEVTVDDPKSYTKPWTVKVNQRAMLDTELIEFICEERDATHYVGAQPAQP